MTIHKLSVGDGYTYLTRHVAGGDVQRQRGQDAGDYYTQKGNPPGRWMGRGARLLGIAGGRVSEEQMKNLFGDGTHPNAGAIVDAYLAEHKRAEMSEAQIKRLVHEAEQHAALGRRFPAYKRLAAFEDRVAERAEQVATETGRPATPGELAVIKKEEAARQRAGVAGFDLVFAPVKSAALVWALHPDPHVRAAIKDAHDAAVDSAMELLEQHAAYTRCGTGGVAQIETRGLIAARFDHFDSRAGDPNLHTHVPVVNKVQGVDGKWRSLDARALYAMTVAASEHYNTRFETEVRARLPVTFSDRADTKPGKEPVREIDGVPLAMVRGFSKRRLDLEDRYQQLIATYRAEHGHDPSPSTCHQLARQATLDTRPAKDEPRSLAEMRARWLAEARTIGGRAGLRSIAAVPGPATRQSPQTVTTLTPDQVHDAARLVVTAVAGQRATWSRWNIHAETERHLRCGFQFTSPADHDYAVRLVTAAAVSADHSIRLDAPTFVAEPEELRRSDGESVFTPHASTRFTSQSVLDAENHLLEAAATKTGHAVNPLDAAAGLHDFAARHSIRLDAGQQHMATAFACDPRLLTVGLGPAGTGKTTTMRALAHILDSQGRRLIPLATSANAAAVLAADLDRPADNLHKFLWEHRLGRHATALANGEPVPASAEFFAVKPGDVILVDEAGMAGTFNLDALVRIASRHGAQVRLLGDHQQLSAVESGGALRLIATDIGAVELSDIHRFTDPREAAATLALRDGHTAGLDFYADRGRIRGGSQDAMTEALYNGWRADVESGKTSVMIAATNADVTALAHRARNDRIAAGQVEHRGVRLHDGNRAGRGDWIVTRDNNRLLSFNGGKDFVRNGATWRVTRRFRDGCLQVANLAGPGSLRLPADYVADHVELAYATTVNRIQGATVDTAHTLITPDQAREHLYVAATRARSHTSLYAVTHDLLPLDEDQRLNKPSWDPDATAAREVLETVLARQGAEPSATQAIRDALTDAESLAVLVPRFQHAIEHAVTDHYTALLTDLAEPGVAEAVLTDGSGPVVRALLTAETHGWPADRLLAFALAQGDLTAPDIESPAAVLAWRIGDLADNHTPPIDLAAPTRADAARYARYLNRHHTRLRLDPDTATTAPHESVPNPHPDQPHTITNEQASDIAAQLAETLNIPAGQVETHPAWPTIVTAYATDPDTASATVGRHRDRSGDRLTALADHLPQPSADAPVPPFRLRCHAAAVDVFGPEHAQRMRRAGAWSAVVSGLHRAHQQGITPHETLTRAAAQRPWNRVDNLAALIAWRIGIHNRLNTTSDPAAPANTWRTLAWTLKAYENSGGNPARLIRSLPATGDLSETLAEIQHATRARQHEHRPNLVNLPWVHAPHSVLDSASVPEGYRDYLRDFADHINDHVHHLTDTATTDNPPWTQTLDHATTRLEDRDKWREALGVIAAFRDQYRITDPEPLGAYIPHGRAGHHAWWDAATALTAHDRRGTTATGLSDTARDALTHHIATTVFQALPESDRSAVIAAMPDHFHHHPAAATDPNTTAVQPTHAPELLAALAHTRHLPKATTPTHHPRHDTTPGPSGDAVPKPHTQPATQAQPRPQTPQPRPDTQPDPQPKLRF